MSIPSSGAEAGAPVASIRSDYALVRLLRDDGLAADMSAAARARACSLFDLRKCRALLESLYEQNVHSSLQST